MFTSTNYQTGFVYSDAHQFCALLQVRKDNSECLLSFGLWGEMSHKFTCTDPTIITFVRNVIEKGCNTGYQILIDYLINVDWFKNRLSEEEVEIVVKLATIGYIP